MKMKEEKKYKIICRVCDTELKKIPQSFDVMSFLQENPPQMYCPKEDCYWFGIVTVAGKKIEVETVGNTP